MAELKQCQPDGLALLDGMSRNAAFMTRGGFDSCYIRLTFAGFLERGPFYER